MRGNGGRNGGNGHNGGHHNNQPGRRVNPRVQTFDSNGPDVRIRGTAYQINEKYVALARDATSAGDRVLAESYLQHAEHYQRFINEMTEEFNQYQQQNPQHQPQPAMVDGAAGAPVAVVTAQPETGMNDLDQGFLVGPRHGHNNGATPAADGQAAAAPNGSGEQPRQEGHQRRHYNNPRRGETEAV